MEMQNLRDRNMVKNTFNFRVLDTIDFCKWTNRFVNDRE